MTLTMDQIKFDTRIPDMPGRVPVVRVKTPCLHEREGNLKRLSDRMQLGEVTRVDTRYGVTLASKRGEVEFFADSGGMWTADVAALEAGENEMRKWDGLERVRDGSGNPVFTLGRDQAAKAQEIAREMVEIGGFDMTHAGKPQLSMVQVAEFSEKGETLQEGAGEATISFGYALEGLPVLGAGAKAQVDLLPGARGDMTVATAFHVWRAPEGSIAMNLGSSEAILDAGLLRDPELEAAVAKEGRITIQEMEFGLMSLSAVHKQGVLFPILRVAGRVDLPKEEHFFFGSYLPAATPEAYAKIGVGGDYLGRTT